jgi:hypothetical protein
MEMDFHKYVAPMSYVLWEVDLNLVMPKIALRQRVKYTVIFSVIPGSFFWSRGLYIGDHASGEWDKNQIREALLCLVICIDILMLTLHYRKQTYIREFTHVRRQNIRTTAINTISLIL